MGRIKRKPKLNREALMPVIRERRKRGETHESIAADINCSASCIQKWLSEEAGWKPQRSSGAIRRN